MNPLKFLKRLVLTEVEVNDPLAALAVLPNMRAEFLAKLSVSRVIIATIGSPLDEEGLDERKILDHVERNLKSFENVTSADQVKPFTYENNGEKFLPIFSSAERLTEFVEGGGEHRLFDRLYAFLGLDANFGYVLNDEFTQFTIVLNPTSHTETTLSARERAIMRAALTEQSS